VWLALRTEGPLARIVVTDDGFGFDLDTPRNGHGLVGMRHRVESEGGCLHIQSASNQGTRIEAELPLCAGPVVPGAAVPA
jgi:signal transduction histidine kinase